MSFVSVRGSFPYPTPKAIHELHEISRKTADSRLETGDCQRSVVFIDITLR